jgi:hypothetical protein
VSTDEGAYRDIIRPYLLQIRFLCGAGFSCTSKPPVLACRELLTHEGSGKVAPGVEDRSNMRTHRVVASIVAFLSLDNGDYLPRLQVTALAAKSDWAR